MSSEVTRPVLTLHTPAMHTFLKLELEMMPRVLSKLGVGVVYVEIIWKFTFFAACM